jgi:hypothetical protein
MIFGNQSAVHKHLSTKHPLSSHRMVEDNAHTKIGEPVQDEGLRLKESLTKREEPTKTESNS